MDNHEIASALERWFDAGHSRFTLILSGARAGSVLIAHDRRPASPDIFERSVVSRATGEIVERSETPLSMDQIAADPDNGPALVQAVGARLAGAIAPPPICQRSLRAPKP